MVQQNMFSTMESLQHHSVFIMLEKKTTPNSATAAAVTATEEFHLLGRLLWSVSESGSPFITTDPFLWRPLALYFFSYKGWKLVAQLCDRLKNVVGWSISKWMQDTPDLECLVSSGTTWIYNIKKNTIEQYRIYLRVLRKVMKQRRNWLMMSGKEERSSTSALRNHPPTVKHDLLSSFLLSLPGLGAFSAAGDCCQVEPRRSPHRRQTWMGGAIDSSRLQAIRQGQSEVSVCNRTHTRRHTRGPHGFKDWVTPEWGVGMTFFFFFSLP